MRFAAPVTSAQLGRLSREQARAGAVRLLARLVERAGDGHLERRFGSEVAQRMLFTAMAMSFRPEAAGGFQGDLVYELTRPATGASALVWTIQVAAGRATARPGTARDAALTLRYPLADFLRMAAGQLDPATPLLQDRATVEGDLSLAARLPEMFGEH